MPESKLFTELLMVETLFGRCDGCGAHRTLYQHGNQWLCKGPNRCYQRRGIGRVNRRKSRPSRSR